MYHVLFGDGTGGVVLANEVQGALTRSATAGIAAAAGRNQTRQAEPTALMLANRPDGQWVLPPGDLRGDAVRVSVFVSTTSMCRNASAVYATVNGTMGDNATCAISGYSGGRGVVLKEAAVAVAMHAARRDGSRREHTA